MGSVVISDVVSDIARFPHAMVVGEHQQTSSSNLDKNRPSSVRSYPSQSSIPTYTPQRYPSATATPTQSSISGSSASLARLASQHPRINPRPVSRGSVQSGSNESTHQSHVNNLNSLSSAQVHGIADGFDRAGFPLSSVPKGLASSPPSPRLQPTLRSSLSLNGSGSTSPNRIKVRDLNHIQSFASEEVLTRSRHGSRRSLRDRQDGGQQYEISAMPVTDIIEMVAGLLTKITNTNDRQHENIHRHIPSPEGATGLSQQTTSMLSFHGKNVPSITILSYLSRIHKYCPTTYEVFLSLLVYFDRMTEVINSGSLESFRHAEDYAEAESRPQSSPSLPGGQNSRSRPQSSASAFIATPPSAGSSDCRGPTDFTPSPSGPSDSIVDVDPYNLSHFFVVDSFNIHRLVIAGVTCASKFFSDVFYTNSRYAKVSPAYLLPAVELT